MPLLTFEDLVTVAGGPASGRLEAGALVLLQGKSGSGKSRLMRALADLDPHQGRAELNGIDRESLSGPEWRQKVGYLAAEVGWWRTTASEHGLNETPEMRELGLDPAILNRPLNQCSSGEKARLAFLRSLAGSPQVMLLDEPTANLDSDTAQAMGSLLRRWVTAGDRAIIWISHDTDSFAHLVDERWVMESGRLTCGPTA